MHLINSPVSVEESVSKALTQVARDKQPSLIPSTVAQIFCPELDAQGWGVVWLKARSKTLPARTSRFG